MVPAWLGGALLKVANNLIDEFFPGPEAKAERDAAKLKVLELHQQGRLAELAADTELAKAGASVIETEAKGESWLQRNWRPITMLVLVGVIVAISFGLSAPLPPEIVVKLIDLIQIGLGGYVAGRSIEKISETLAPAIQKWNEGRKG